jgi:hypothetical protein
MGLLVGLATLFGVAVARAESPEPVSACDSYAELHWAMAESVGLDGPELDAAWEDAASRCESSEGVPAVRVVRLPEMVIRAAAPVPAGESRRHELVQGSGGVLVTASAATWARWAL